MGRASAVVLAVALASVLIALARADSGEHWPGEGRNGRLSCCDKHAELCAAIAGRLVTCRTDLEYEAPHRMASQKSQCTRTRLSDLQLCAILIRASI